jgi:pimeloyl-ACP methyl ester carboxylesterase
VADSNYVQRPGGRIAYTLTGEGPLVVCLPGMGDVRSVFDPLALALADAGFRVAAMDLRGHGDSDTTFDTYDDVAAGSDLIALTHQLGGPAVLIGNSMGAGAACWAAAERPELVRGLVLIGPFVRDGSPNVFSAALLRLALLRPWGMATWKAYLRSAYPTRREASREHVDEIVANLSKPGHWDAFSKTTHTTHAPAEARLSEVRAPAFVVMGDKDPDWPDPEAEARWVADALHAELLMVDGAGHYPQAEFPEIVGPAVTEWLMRLT